MVGLLLARPDRPQSDNHSPHCSNRRRGSHLPCRLETTKSHQPVSPQSPTGMVPNSPWFRLTTPSVSARDPGGVVSLKREEGVAAKGFLLQQGGPVVQPIVSGGGGQRGVKPHMKQTNPRGGPTVTRGGCRRWRPREEAGGGGAYHRRETERAGKEEEGPLEHIASYLKPLNLHCGNNPIVVPV